MPPQQPDSPGIKWNGVTWYSQVIAVILFVGIFGLGFYLGGLNFSFSNSLQEIVDHSTLSKQVNPLDTNPSAVDKNENLLPGYVFKNFPFLKEGRQIYLKGIFTPVKVRLGFYSLENKEVSIRCWEKEMLCIWGDIPIEGINFREGYTPRIYNPIYRPETGFLRVTEWSKDKVIAQGILGDFPDCEKDSCSSDLNLMIDLARQKVYVTYKACWVGCAEDEYLLVGEGDGEHRTGSDLPIPEESTIPII